jgi:hypothetical protein
LLTDPFVPLPVALNLFLPKCSVAARPFKQMTVMPVPEAPIDKNNGAVARKHYVWTAGQMFRVKPIAEPEGEDRLAQ